MPYCKTPMCSKYGKELQPHEMELVGNLLVCKGCDGEVRDGPSTPSGEVLTGTVTPEPMQPSQSHPAVTEWVADDDFLTPGPQQPDIHDSDQVTPQSSTSTPAPPTPVNSAANEALPWSDIDPFESQIQESVPPPTSIPPDQTIPPIQQGGGFAPFSQAFEPPGLSVDEDSFELTGASEFPWLEVYQGGQVRSRVELRGDVFVIGRYSAKYPEPPDLDLSRMVNGKNISRRHCQIVQQEGIYYVEDLGSKAGTYLGDQELTPFIRIPLEDEAEIVLGEDAVLVFHWAGERSSPYD